MPSIEKHPNDTLSLTTIVPETIEPTLGPAEERADNTIMEADMTISNASRSEVLSEKMLAHHETLRAAFGGRAGDIDEKIAPLIKEMWRAHFTTYMPRQDCSDGFVWIIFVSSCELELFLSIVTDDDTTPGSMHERMYGKGGDLAWDYRFEVKDLAVKLVESDARGFKKICIDEPCFVVKAFLRFPHADLPQVLRRLERFNRDRARAREATHTA